jgi:hypothetical protein
MSLLLRFALRYISLFEDVFRALLGLYLGKMTATKTLHFSPYSENFIRRENTTRLWAIIICVVNELSQAVKGRYFCHLGIKKFAMLS